MRLHHVLLQDFRSYEHAELLPAPGLTVIAGPNAAGKTNLLESIFVAIAGRSPRADADHDLVRQGAPFARVQLDLTDDDGRRTTRIELVLPAGGSSGAAAGADGAARVGSAETRKRVLVNRVPRRASGLGDVARVVLFRPEEMLLLVGAPSERRRFLDTILAQRERLAARDLAHLARVLAQRNALLRAVRTEEADPAELAYWDEQLIEVGSRVMHARLRLVADLGELIGPLHARIAPAAERGDGLALEYVDSLKLHATGHGREAREPARTTPTLAELAEAFRARLESVRQKEVWNGVSLVGPHRDDLRVLLGERDVSLHASRGQQRTIILGLKLAETRLLSGGDAGEPLVLLDDVFSELDPQRTARALELLLERGQVLVTTADVRSLPAERRRGVPIWHVREGRLSDAPLVA